MFAVLSAYLYATGNYSVLGPCVIATFIMLAIGVLGSSKVSTLSYTLWIMAAVSTSMFYPAVFYSIGDFQLSGLIVPLLQIIMFGMGTTMSANDFVGVIKMPKGVLVGVFCQFVIMPSLGFALAKTFSFPPEIAAGLILVGSSPSGLASNVMAFIAKANVALSVTLTAVATLLAPLMTPLLMKLLAGEFVPVDFWAMMISIIKMVIIPIGAGLLFNHLVKKPNDWQRQTSTSMIILLSSVLMLAGLLLNWFINPAQPVASILVEIVWIVLFTTGLALLLQKTVKNQNLIDQFMPLVSMVGIAFIIAIITAAGREDLLKVGGLLILACFLHNTFGYLFGYMGAKLAGLDQKSCRTVAIEVGLQNGGLASGIAKEMGRLATVGLAAAIFGPMMNVTGSSLASWWRGRPIKGEEQIEAGGTMT